MAYKEGNIDKGKFVEFDYLSSYVDKNGFNIAKLINDDFFLAIKLLYNNGLYVSSTKLLLIFLDAISFVAYSDSSAQNFKMWLDTYVDLKTLGLTSEELWEHRNAMLHFTGLDSRKTRSGKTRRCMAYVGTRDDSMPKSLPDEVWYNLNDLISAIAIGIEAFLNTIFPRHAETFIRNYDQVCSDVRMLVLHKSST